MVSLHDITKRGKAFFLAYDQGLEHGPEDLNFDNADPDYIFQLGIEGKFTAVIAHRGIAEHYYAKYRYKVPLILKLNGKTKLHPGPDFSPLLTTVDQAIALGACAVGYTIYLGSQRDDEMLATFAQIVNEAHAANIPAIAWMYPRGPKIANDTDPAITAYAARVGMELGADMVKIKYPGSPDALHWVKQACGKTQVVVAGGAKQTKETLYQEVADIMKAGVAGLAIGRNIWQQEKPLEIAEKLRAIVFQ